MFQQQTADVADAMFRQQREDIAGAMFRQQREDIADAMAQVTHNENNRKFVLKSRTDTFPR
jgi:hypothetical protein